MIVVEKPNEYLMITQHDHADLSGQFARNWNRTYFEGLTRFDDVIEGITHHDRSWIVVDDTPFIHDAAGAPYSFMDFPLRMKLHFYIVGLDELEKINRYGCLLASLHYCSFFEKNTDGYTRAFLLHESRRQQRLRSQCHISSEQDKELSFHFRLLQLCDDLSLFVCLNEPGVHKTEEHPWFQKGFSNSERFNRESDEPLIASWVNDKQIEFSFFPFARDFSIELLYRVVAKSQVEQRGIAVAYHEAKINKQIFEIKERVEK